MTPEPFNLGDPNSPLIDMTDYQARRRAAPEANKLLFYTAKGHSVDIEGHYRGAPVFLLLSGPSLVQNDLSLLNHRGVMTMCVNNSWSVFKPNIWTAVDDPCQFLDIGWKDPSILKLVPHGKIESQLGLKEADGTFKKSAFRVHQMPNVLFYPRNERFNVDTYLTEPTVNWGNHQKVTDALGCKGSRSVMMAAVRLLHYLGFRTIYLVGADFQMVEGAAMNYAFPQPREAGAVHGNNNTYADMDKRFKALKPVFGAAGLKVFNCYEKSGLKAFPYKPFEECVAEATGRFTKVIDTDGWYTAFKAPKKKKKK